MEKDAITVTSGDWLSNIHEELKADLIKHRKYKSDSVCDLLRAIRNKVSSNVEHFEIILTVDTIGTYRYLLLLYL